MKHFDVGDLIYKRNAAFRAGESRKLNPLYTGPYVVVEVLSPALFRVVDQKRSYVMHHDRMKICEDRSVPLWARRKRHRLVAEELAVEVSEVAGNEEFEEVTDGGDLSAGVDMPGTEELDETVAYEFADKRNWRMGCGICFLRGR